MKVHPAGTILFSFFLMLWAPGGFAQESINASGLESKWTFGFEMDNANKYVWRGLTQNEGLVLQPNIWIQRNGFSAGLWSNLTAWDRMGSTPRNELDIIFTYQHSAGFLEVDHTVMFYYYPGQDDSPPTAEYFLGLNCPLGPFSVFSSATVDFITYPGSLWFEHGFSATHEIAEGIQINASVLLGWANGIFNENYIGIEGTRFNLIGLNGEIEFSLGESAWIKPHMQFNRMLQSDIASITGRFPWFAGITFGIEK